jgi:hypothetical protein
MSKTSAAGSDAAQHADNKGKSVRQAGESKKRTAEEHDEGEAKQGASRKVQDADERPGKKPRAEDCELTCSACCVHQ